MTEIYCFSIVIYINKIHQLYAHRLYMYTFLYFNQKLFGLYYIKLFKRMYNLFW